MSLVKRKHSKIASRSLSMSKKKLLVILNSPKKRVKGAKSKKGSNQNSIPPPLIKKSFVKRKRTESTASLARASHNSTKLAIKTTGDTASQNQLKGRSKFQLPKTALTTPKEAKLKNIFRKGLSKSKAFTSFMDVYDKAKVAQKLSEIKDIKERRCFLDYVATMRFEKKDVIQKYQIKKNRKNVSAFIKNLKNSTTQKEENRAYFSNLVNASKRVLAANKKNSMMNNLRSIVKKEQSRSALLPIKAQKIEEEENPEGDPQNGTKIDSNQSNFKDGVFELKNQSKDQKNDTSQQNPPNYSPSRLRTSLPIVNHSKSLIGIQSPNKRPPKLSILGFNNRHIRSNKKISMINLGRRRSIRPENDPESPTKKPDPTNNTLSFWKKMVHTEQVKKDRLVDSPTFSRVKSKAVILRKNAAAAQKLETEEIEHYPVMRQNNHTSVKFIRKRKNILPLNTAFRTIFNDSEESDSSEELGKNVNAVERILGNFWSSGVDQGGGASLLFRIKEAKTELMRKRQQSLKRLEDHKKKRKGSDQG